MPPKKKDTTETSEATTEAHIEAYELPRALVTRIAKSEVSLVLRVMHLNKWMKYTQ
jgi:hypothetical protein